MAEQDPIKSSLVRVGQFDSRKEAEERALVISAMGHASRIEPAEEGGFDLMVYEWNLEAVVSELERFEIEKSEAAAAREPERQAPREKIPVVSLFVAGWVMSGFFLAQNLSPVWEPRGIASSQAIIGKAEWWRALTALTLHHDFSHFAANLAAGLLFARFLLPQLGTGWSWLLILSSGFLGNLLNAWTYRGESHLSLGASTAVFGALAILSACQALDVLRSSRAFRRWELILPVGAGLALLAFLGTGDERTDLTAHCWGFLCGAALGALATWFQLKERTSPLAQRCLSTVAIALPLLAWSLARAAKL